MAKTQLQEGALGPGKDVDSEEQGLNRLGGKQASASCAESCMSLEPRHTTPICRMDHRGPPICKRTNRGPERRKDLPKVTLEVCRDINTYSPSR